VMGVCGQACPGSPRMVPWRSVRSARHGACVSDVLALLAVLLTAALLWTGVKRLEVATPLKAVLTALDLVALGFALVQLGWAGLVVFVVANVVGFLAWGVAGAVYVDAELSTGAALGATDKAALRAVYNGLARERALRAMGPRWRAVLVRALAERARAPEEVAQMAVPIGLLWVAHRPDLEALVDDFDTLLRRFGKGAEEAMSVADTLSASTTRSAATFDQSIEALLAASA
jgi:hypothetical protein